MIGSALQFGVQLPVVLRLTRKLRLRLDTRAAHVREVLRNFVPVFFSRGVVQISGYVDQVIASLVGAGAVAALAYAQSINTLPVSLFGMAISAAELPAMSSALGDAAEVAAQLQARLDSGLRRIAFFVVPSAVAFLALGDVIDGGAVSDREIHARRFALRLGNPGRLRGGAAGVHAGTPVFLDLLRVARYAHAAAIRRGAGLADHRPGLFVRDSPAAMDRH